MRVCFIVMMRDLLCTLLQLADDHENTVRNGSEVLDRLMKDIVTESLSFNVPSFIPLLRERIYVKKPFCRRFIVSWVRLSSAIHISLTTSL